METKEWEELHNRLRTFYSEFLNVFYDSNTAKSKNAKEKSLERIYDMIGKSIDSLPDIPEVNLLVYHEENPSEMKRSVILEDLRKPRYFEADMERIIQAIHLQTVSANSKI
ncbi:hypothetical protein MHJ94_03610 [Chryseobacterium taklimakanense]|uniref:Uncharacterized protein n=1 Tax=Chryseobacterium taklimakanense TaxID=536441 RepID=A0A239X5X2_9FLAO|nr:hypothetical protein [Chryseobacterium taklimakanense]MCG7280376.1 hypothetical protein [Chryseobacterium taklimakanense]SNV42072.1 Uncharacterised protein [Chryseobacterium taklimakanense]